MKISIHDASGYLSLQNLDFPLIVEASKISEDEYALVEEAKSLSDLYGDGARGDLEEAADLAAKDMAEKVFGADRKALLLRLVMDYADAINNSCYTSERGSAESLKACIAKEERLLKEITKMIEEGV